VDTPLNRTDWVRSTRRVVLDLIAPIAGLTGLGWLISQPTQGERPTLVFACLALLGLPFARLADRLRRLEEDE
jgi:hypothetical protein